MSLVNYAVATGSALIIGDYLDRKLSLLKDAELLPKLATVKFGLDDFIKKDKTVADLWEESVRKYPNKESIVFEGKSLTFKEVDAQANRIAHWIASKGFKKGDVVALYMENKPEFIISWLGLAKAGLVIAFINHNLVGKGLVHCIKVSDAKMVLFGSEFAQVMGDNKELIETEYTKLPFVSYGGAVDFAEHLDPELLNHSPETPPRSVRKGCKATDPFAFVYTSGTSGLPKAAIIPNFRFLLSTSVMGSMFSVRNTDRIYVALPLYHSAGGLIGAGMMVWIGATVILRRKFSASQFFDDIRKYECTVFQYIGELCRYLLATPSSPQESQHKLRIAIGNGLRPDIWEQFQNRFKIPCIGEFYAATEGNTALFNQVQLGGEGSGAVGRMGYLYRAIIPIKILKFDVAKEEPIRGPNGFCIECGPGEVGEMVGLIDNDPIRRFSGYYKNSSGNEKKILRNVFKKGDAYFRTGDLLKRNEKGYYFFVDRIGDTFRWKGENVSTTEVAEALSIFPGVKEANVYGVSVPGKDGRAGMAGIVTEENFDFASFGDHVAKSLPTYAVPLFLRKLPQIDTTGTFKHLKGDLRNQGFDPSAIQDPLFFFDWSTKAYKPLTKAQYDEIVLGKSKL